MNIKKIIKDNYKMLSKFSLVGGVITLIHYLSGIVFVDMLGWKYYKAGVIIIPTLFIVRFILEKKWVFKK